MTKLILLFVVLMLSPTSLVAEVLPVSITTSVSENLPDFEKRIMRVLHKTGFEISIDYFPPKRSFALLTKGQIAVEFIRTPSIIPESNELIRLEPLLHSFEFKMLTSAKTPEICEITEEYYADYTIAGVMGVFVFPEYFFPKFQSYVALRRVSSLVQFVAYQRADLTFIPSEALSTLSDELAADVLICDAHTKVFDFYAYLHRDYLWAKDALEAAMISEFSHKTLEPELQTALPK